MRSGSAEIEIIKRNITIVLIALLTFVCCGSIEPAYGSFSSGGSISRSSGFSVSHSLVAFPSSAVRQDNSGRSSDHQDIERGCAGHDIFSRIIRKLLEIIGSGTLAGSPAILRYYLFYLCISGFTCLFLLTHIRFIHLKDGSK